MKLRSGEPRMPADQYARSLEGLTINLLVREVAAALPFHRQVLDAEEVYRDPDEAEALAREPGYEVLAGASDRPHGLREAFSVEGDGYVWVTDIPSAR